jgi:anaerobic magnesium-protoporphyrin IX monomethyl ester cyclase
MMPGMRVCFFGVATEQLGISMLSAVLRRAGHETALVFDPGVFNDGHYFDIPVLRDIFSVRHRMVDAIVALKPDLLAFSVLTVHYQYFLQVATEVKRRLDVPVIFGGIHASAVPEVCLENDCVDYVCVGEGEHAIVELCNALENGGGRPPSRPLPNLCWRDGRGGIVRGPNAPFIQDLDELPFADKELWEGRVDLASEYRMMTGRGCAYRCTFCFNSFFAKLPGNGGGKFVRQRSVASCIEELAWAKKRFRIRTVNFADDIFTTYKDWIEEFTREYKREIDLPFSCIVHPKFMDRDIARWLAAAGCHRVEVGIQSADELYKRALARYEKDVDVHRALEALNEAGIIFKVDHIFGSPEEREDANEDAWQLYCRYRPARINTYWLTYLPGTELTRQAAANGTVGEEELYAINRGRGGNQHRLSKWREARRRENAKLRRYELLFRALPLIPKKLRNRVRVAHVPRLPDHLYTAANIACDLTAAILQRDTDSYLYARHYAYQMAHIAFERLTRKPLALPRWLPPRERPPRLAVPARAASEVAVPPAQLAAVESSLPAA